MSLLDQTTLRTYIQTKTGLNVRPSYDGIELKVEEKPFATIKLLNDVDLSSTKLKDSIESRELYEIVIYPTSNKEQRTLCNEIKKALSCASFDSFIVEDNIGVQPVGPDSPSDLLNYHRAFISVTILKRNNRRN
ncbi:hypothetical protein LL50_05560 [Listeria monocytogenes]|nr:hypothetical protein [Listeria monocytogenes]EAD0383077.1 hypothetical protein [Listeria monocytogenes]EAD9128488.1 hypothetical protein [Listeria monocytogenes]EAE9170436.1 hypothetical protein [Listeria monocytogenes]EAF2023420.1 hypothetical protein [Listeria monocytogenes]